MPTWLSSTTITVGCEIAASSWRFDPKGLGPGQLISQSGEPLGAPRLLLNQDRHYQNEEAVTALAVDDGFLVVSFPGKYEAGAPVWVQYVDLDGNPSRASKLAVVGQTGRSPICRR